MRPVRRAQVGEIRECFQPVIQLGFGQVALQRRFGGDEFVAIRRVLPVAENLVGCGAERIDDGRVEVPRASRPRHVDRGPDTVGLVVDLDEVGHMEQPHLGRDLLATPRRLARRARPSG